MARRTIKSMLAAVLLCLVMLPVTALAAAPSGQVIYVGDEAVTGDGYWTTDDSGNVTAYSGEDTPTDNYIHYDAADNTLTLHNATIREHVPSDTSTYVMGAGIGVFNQNDASKLTIKLERSNAIENVSTGICVLAFSYSTGDASLTITGSGSLDTSGRNNPAIKVQSNGGNATLSIENAKVTATASSSGYGGLVQSKNDSSVSLTVDGGSLTATGSGNDGAGIQLLFGSGDSGSGTPTVTVSNNAIMRASGNADGIASNASAATPSGTGIVFDGGTGTVYGDVTLQENITINEGESLTIPDGASLNTGSHEVIVNGGTLTGGDKITGTVNYAPTITTKSLPNGTVGAAYSQTLAATGSGTITWSITSGSLPAGLNLNESTGEITGTPTAEGSSTFTVKAENRYGSDSRELSITINAPASVSVTGVSLDKTELILTEGDSEALKATIAPADATNKGVTWSSSAESVATVDASGKVTAVTPGTATITVTTEDGNKTASCKVTVIAKTYGISASPAVLSFGSAYVGYSQPAAQMVTVTNTGNQAVTLTQPTSASYEIGTLSATELKPNDAATFTVRPKPGLAVGAYAETLTISGSDGVSAAVSLSFSVSSRPYIPPTPSGPNWDDVAGDITDTVDGGRIVVDMDGVTELPGEVLEALAGRDVTLVLEMGEGVAWEVWGGDVPEGASFSDVDMGVELGTSAIPVDVVDLVAGEVGSTQVTLAHEGPFGFTLTFVAPVGEKNAGLVANMYRYDAVAGMLRYECSGAVDGNGLARVRIDHASSWLLALDSRSHALPFPDAAEGQWYSEAVRWAWISGAMTGYGDGSGLFGTEASLSRAEMATVLWRLAGEPASSETLPADCDGSAFYAGAVSWALGAGCFTGYDGGSFGPADALTREQAATVLWRLAGEPEADADLSAFADASDASGYALAALRWAVSEGVLRGTGEGVLEPGRAVTRAEMAAVLMRVEVAGR